MARTKQPSRNDASDAREALLRAATALFGERGPASVSTREIAALANVNSGLIHRHFRTKDRLLREVLNELAHEIGNGSPLRNSRDPRLQQDVVGDQLPFLAKSGQQRLHQQRQTVLCQVNGLVGRDLLAPVHSGVKSGSQRKRRRPPGQPGGCAGRDICDRRREEVVEQSRQLALERIGVAV